MPTVALKFGVVVGRQLILWLNMLPLFLLAELKMSDSSF